MRLKVLISMLLFSCTLCAQSPAAKKQGQAPSGAPARLLTFKGLTPGVSKRSQVEEFDKKIAMSFQCDDINERSSCTAGQWDSDTRSFTEYYSLQYYKGTLVSVDYRFPHDSFDDVALALRSKYGHPTNASVVSYQNGMGARFKGQKAMWLAGREVLSLEEYASKIDQSSLFLMDSRLEEVLTRFDDNAKAKDGRSRIE